MKDNKNLKLKTRLEALIDIYNSIVVEKTRLEIQIRVNSRHMIKNALQPSDENIVKKQNKEDGFRIEAFNDMLAVVLEEITETKKKEKKNDLLN